LTSFAKCFTVAFSELVTRSSRAAADASSGDPREATATRNARVKDGRPPPPGRDARRRPAKDAPRAATTTTPPPPPPVGVPVRDQTRDDANRRVNPRSATLARHDIREPDAASRREGAAGRRTKRGVEARA
jgi:hypothetical protein